MDVVMRLVSSTDGRWLKWCLHHIAISPSLGTAILLHYAMYTGRLLLGRSGVTSLSTHPRDRQAVMFVWCGDILSHLVLC